MSDRSNPALSGALAACLLALCGSANAEIDRVYHPYVEPLETDLEWRSVVVDDGDNPYDGEQLHRLALGHAFGDRLFAEGYLTGRKTETQGFKINGFELEGLYELTEPGEHGVDLALLVEFQRDTDRDISYAGGGIVAEKEFGATSLALNLLAEYEYGNGIKEEIDTELAAQWRWRWRESFEPAIEYYMGENTQGLGPMMTGRQRLGSRQKLNWEFGLILGVGDNTPARTWRALLEFEF